VVDVDAVSAGGVGGIPRIALAALAALVVGTARTIGIDRIARPIGIALNVVTVATALAVMGITLPAEIALAVGIAVLVGTADIAGVAGVRGRPVC
jgi:hypothetical protein